jgi:carbonic anhydrase
LLPRNGNAQVKLLPDPGDSVAAFWAHVKHQADRHCGHPSPRDEDNTLVWRDGLLQARKDRYKAATITRPVGAIMKINVELLVSIPALTLALIALTSAQEHKPGHWGYDGDEGPSHWGTLQPEFATCKTGHRQSPIDIRNPQKSGLPAIQFEYKSSPLHIIDNGHTIMINYAPGSSIRVGDKQYTLKQFHFHRPSEEKIDGKSDKMDIHLVHADQNGSLAVVAIQLVTGVDNPVVKELWNDCLRKNRKKSC